MNRITLINPQQAHLAVSNLFKNYIKPMTMGGNRLELEVRSSEDALTDRQRAYYHGYVLTVIAQQVKVNGQRYAMPVWKEHYRKEFLGFKTKTCINPITGKKYRTRVRQSTEGLGVRGYSKLIERVTSHAGQEFGVMFPVTLEEWIAQDDVEAVA